jgi:energy-coupling factor transport system ATP-binding protein
VPLGAASLRGFSWRPLGRKVPTLSGLDLRIEPGERVLLVGPSGAGKSTILHAFAGALGTTLAGTASGDIEVEGRIGLLLQNPGAAVVAERIGRDVAFGPENLGLDRDAIWARVDAALEAVRLPYGRDHFTSALSGGETQRLALAGVLAMRPDLLLLDEPTSMLDEDSAAAVRESILATVGNGTLLIVEHRIQPWLPYVDRVIVLGVGGQIVDDTTPQGLVEGPPPSGVWMPGMAVPVPLAIPTRLVAPFAAAIEPAATDLDVELVTRSLRGVQRTVAIRDVSTAIEAGRVAAYVGPSGAGKSTLIAALGGLLAPARGVLTPALHRLSTRALAADVGWVPQNPEAGFLTDSVESEVMLTASGLQRSIDVSEVLDVFGLSGLARAHPYRLSGGEQRRLALAAALAHRPGLVLLDEPTVGQDPDTWAAVVGWMTSAAEAGCTVALATHDDEVPVDDRHPMVGGELS